MLIRFALATVLSGFIGYEREHSNRPAGFRTHILVCVGACLVMLTSEYIFKNYQGLTNFDPTRLGAQVISGVGFLGAGTIIRNGNNVKGLTTAASLWAVSCVGLACGSGFYSGAIFCTIVTYTTLLLFKKIEKNTREKKNLQSNTLILEISRNNPDVQEIIRIVEGLQTRVCDLQLVEMSNSPDDVFQVRIQTEPITPLRRAELMDSLLRQKSIIRLVEDNLETTSVVL